jgi:hypothetical protein
MIALHSRKSWLGSGVLGSCKKLHPVWVWGTRICGQKPLRTAARVRKKEKREKKNKGEISKKNKPMKKEEEEEEEVGEGEKQRPEAHPVMLQI